MEAARIAQRRGPARNSISLLYTLLPQAVPKLLCENLPMPRFSFSWFFVSNFFDSCSFVPNPLYPISLLAKSLLRTHVSVPFPVVTARAGEGAEFAARTRPRAASKLLCEELQMPQTAVLATLVVLPELRLKAALESHRQLRKTANIKNKCACLAGAMRACAPGLVQGAAAATRRRPRDVRSAGEPAHMKYVMWIHGTYSLLNRHTLYATGSIEYTTVCYGARWSQLPNPTRLRISYIPNCTYLPVIHQVKYVQELREERDELLRRLQSMAPLSIDDAAATGMYQKAPGVPLILGAARRWGRVA
eukprot:2037587-Pleurochrysis_carterae.AAC.1